MGGYRESLLVPLLVLFCWIGYGSCDTPANCTFDDVKGTWTFYETERIYGPDIDCKTANENPLHKKRVSLSYPNVAVDDYGNKGVWTMVYNQGFEVKVAGRSYFAFSAYKTLENDTVVSYCDQTLQGWSRDVTIRNWACFKGVKMEKVEPKIHVEEKPKNLETMHKNDIEFVNAINQRQTSWTARVYPEYDSMTLGDIQKRAGGHNFKVNVPSAKPSPLTKLRAMILPDEFDWRNVSGVNYVSPIRNQEKCGSCYAFAAMAGLESRVRIMTRNRQKPVFSPQDVVDCSELSQGCSGGFPYLIAGRYAQDHGVVEEHCNHYVGGEQVCVRNPKCIPHYTAYYRYVGGYFGGCNEEEMKIALIKGGPLMVGFEVYYEFKYYSGGIYHHEEYLGVGGNFNPLEETNHAVLIVGYGFDSEKKEKFWIVKNSWGDGWGEKGFFRIRRGNDECGMESMAFEAVPIPA